MDKVAESEIPCYDLAYICKFGEEELRKLQLAKMIVHSLQNAGFQVDLELDAEIENTTGHRLSFVMIHLPFEALAREMEAEGKLLECKHEHSCDASYGNGLFKPFKMDNLHDFRNWKDHDRMFPSSARHAAIQKLIRSIPLAPEWVNSSKEIEEHSKEEAEEEVPQDSNSSNVTLTSFLKTEGILTDQLWLHHRHLARRLRREWLLGSFRLSLSPAQLDDIRHYFGARIALYFAFLGHYTKMLLVPTLCGLLVIVGREFNDQNHTLATSLMSFLLPLWSCWMLASWTRHRSALTMRWGLQYDEAERQPHTKLANYRKFENNFKYRHLSWVVISVLVLVGVMMTVALEATTPCMNTAWSLCPAGQVELLGLQYTHIAVYIAVDTALIALCKHVALWLNRQRVKPRLWYSQSEQHEEEQLVQNIWGMYFVEYYVTLCYYAFWLQDLDRLVVYMGSLMTLKQGISLFMEAGLPFLQLKVWPAFRTRFLRGHPPSAAGNASEVVKESCQLDTNQKPFDQSSSDQESGGNVETRHRAIERVSQQSKLATYDDENIHSGMFDDFIHICFQFGYVTLFGAAYPLAALYALANNLVEMRTDAFKMLHLLRRPRARPAISLGVWIQAFQLMSLLSILFNGGIIAFTNSSTAQHFSSLQEKMLVIFVIEHVLLALRRAILAMLPEIPDAVCRRLATQEAFERSEGYHSRTVEDETGDTASQGVKSYWDSIVSAFQPTKEE